MKEDIKLVVFKYEDNYYGIDFEIVEEVVKVSELNIYKIPKAPYYVEGLINFRGDVVPMINLIKKFNMSNKVNILTSIIVKIDSYKIGLIIDIDTELQELNLKDNNIELKDMDKERYFKGVVLDGEKKYFILDIKQLLDIGDYIEK